MVSPATLYGLAGDVERRAPQQEIRIIRKHLDTKKSWHHDVAMRSTITLDDDVAKALREQARRTGQSFKAVVNATLRRGLTRGDRPGPRLPRFAVKPKACGFRTGVDPFRLNQLADELEMEAFEAKRHPGTGTR
jgi:plasmid stability protein